MEIESLIEQLRRFGGELGATPLNNVIGKYMLQAADALEKLQAELKQVKRERDAAVEGLRVCSIENNMECQYCLYRTARRRADNEEDDKKGVREIVAR